MNQETKVKFYQVNNGGISVSIMAYLDDGRLSLRGIDHGTSVDEIRGAGEDYEYELSLNEENSRKLFELLNIVDKTDIEKLEKVRDDFGKNGGISELREYCKAHNIEASFFCWP